MVDEGLCAPGRLGNGEDLGKPSAEANQRVSSGLPNSHRHRTHVHQDLLDDLHVRSVVELLVKDDDGPRALEAVSGHLELVHGVGVEDVEANGRAVGSLGGPEVQVVVLATSLEEQGVVAVGKVAKFVDEGQLVLRVELGICRG